VKFGRKPKLRAQQNRPRPEAYRSGRAARRRCCAFESQPRYALTGACIIVVMPIRTLALSFALSVSLFAQSQSPRPPVKASQPATGSLPAGTDARVKSDPISDMAESSKSRPPQGGQDPIVRYTFWLLIVGALQAIIFVAQAVIFYYTLHATSKSASAAKQSADAYMVSQRAQLMTLVRKPMLPPPSIGHELQVVVELKNIGATPANSCTYQTWIEMLPVPFTEFTDAADYFASPAPTTVYSNSPTPTSLTLARRRALTNGELQWWMNGQINLCFRIYLEYKDAFKCTHHANFGYEVNPEHLGLLAKYNDAD